MSIQSDKLMNLGDGQVLYNDLRGRVEEKTSHKDVHDFVYSGIEEYTPGTTKTFYKGTFYHEVGSSYVCTPVVDSIEIVAEEGVPEANWEHLPTTPGTGFFWAVYTLNGYIEARIAALQSSSPDIMSIYTGVSEYTPTIDPVFAPGIFYHQTGTNYIGVIKASSALTPYDVNGVEIPSESDSNWDIMYFGDPGLKEAMMFPIPGITEYTPAESFSMSPNTAYHEVGSKYVCVLNDTYLLEFDASGTPVVTGGRTFGSSPVYHLPITSTNYINVYTLGSFMSAWRDKRASNSNPIFSGELSIQGAKLSRATMLTLLGLINDNGTYATPPTTIKLGSTTLTETQLQSLLAMIT